MAPSLTRRLCGPVESFELGRRPTWKCAERVIFVRARLESTYESLQGCCQGTICGGYPCPTKSIPPDHSQQLDDRYDCAGADRHALRHGIALEVIQPSYDQVAQEALAPESKVNSSKPDAVLSCPRLSRPAAEARARRRASRFRCSSGGSSAIFRCCVTASRRTPMRSVSSKPSRPRLSRCSAASIAWFRAHCASCSMRSIANWPQWFAPRVTCSSMSRPWLKPLA